MKTLTSFKKISQKAFLLLVATIVSVLCQAQSGNNNFGNGLNFDNPQPQSGNDLEVGATYLFSNVENNVDAVVRIDSLVNGAKVNKIDDNSNGTGYKQAFQPAIQSGGIIGMSYAVFTIKFYEHGTSNPVSLPVVNATALDLDGSNTLKEFARINVGNSGIMNYLIATPDISVVQLLPGDFFGQNILGIERNGIDTSAMANMFTASNSNISSFTVKYGTITLNPSNSVRQFSLYMKRFNYPGTTLPVKLASFTATLNNKKADLKWSTATEINLNYFMVEKSTDGTNFTDAGMVFAYGNTTDRMNYSFSDNVSNIENGVVYYRLRSVDIDGRTQLSETRMIRIKKSEVNSITIIAYPNPVSNQLQVTIPANWQNKKVVYDVVALNGQLSRRNESASSSQTETINVTNLAPGMYFVRVSCQGQTAQQKIVKQ
jgi:Secretion system C-terminal sorting domain